VLHESLAAAEELAPEGIDIEVIDPRSLNPLDADTILESVRRTGRLCIVHEDTRTLGVGAELAALAVEQSLDDLRAPVERIAMADVAGIPASAPMEDFLIPDRARIAAALRALTSIDRGQRVNGHGITIDIPQASSVVEIDLSRARRRLDEVGEAWNQRGIQGNSYTALFAESLLAALREVPQANAAFDGQARGIRRHRGVHLGVSLASPDGNAVRRGIIRDADTRNVLGLAMELDALTREAGSDRDSLADATITLADYGPESAMFAVPEVLPGQVAAVRIGAVEERLVVRDHGFALAPTAFVCASIDHRALDGMDAGSLLTSMKRFLEDER
jgi:pyruvate/2-oxoglutarate dehydrogenase complex dihydrolipoamide acyltransferase (E2) component